MIGIQDSYIVTFLSVKRIMKWDDMSETFNRRDDQKNPISVLGHARYSEVNLPQEKTNSSLLPKISMIAEGSNHQHCGPMAMKYQQPLPSLAPPPIPSSSRQAAQSALPANAHQGWS